MKNDSRFLFFELLWIRSGRDSPCRQARKRFAFCSAPKEMLLSRHSPYTSKSTDRRLRASSTRLTVALSVHGSLLSRKSKQGHSKKAASGTGVGIETSHTGCKNHYTNFFNKIYKLLVENLFFGRKGAVRRQGTVLCLLVSSRTVPCLPLFRFIRRLQSSDRGRQCIQEFPGEWEGRRA